MIQQGLGQKLTSLLKLTKIVRSDSTAYVYGSVIWTFVDFVLARAQYKIIEHFSANISFLEQYTRYRAEAGCSKED